MLFLPGQFSVQISGFVFQHPLAISVKSVFLVRLKFFCNHEKPLFFALLLTTTEKGVLKDDYSQKKSKAARKILNAT